MQAPKSTDPAGFMLATCSCNCRPSLFFQSILPKMSGPVYYDFSKSFNDLIGKDFPVGSTKLEVITTTPNGVKFTILGSKNHQKENGIDSSVKAKFTDKARGISLGLTRSYPYRNLDRCKCFNCSSRNGRCH